MNESGDWDVVSFSLRCNVPHYGPLDVLISNRRLYQERLFRIFGSRGNVVPDPGQTRTSSMSFKSHFLVWDIPS